MKETRVQKWKAYRESLIKQEAQIEEDADSIRSIEVKSKDSLRQTISATATLPISEVIKGISEEEVKQKESIAPKVIKITLISLAAVLVIVGLVFWGIWVFGGK